MTTKNIDLSTLNVYQKLIHARMIFQQRGVKKTGKNLHLSIMYFELEDIVPHVTDISAQLNLLFMTSFGETTATMTVINADAPCESIVFEAPMVIMKGIVSNQGKNVTNELQSLGASQTYLRRYLYLTAMDIVEADAVENPDERAEIEKPAPKTTPKTPPTPAERTTLQTEVIKDNDQASPAQIKALKACLNKLLKTNPKSSAMVEQISLKTNNYTNIKASECEQLLVKLSEMLFSAEGGIQNEV